VFRKTAQVGGHLSLDVMEELIAARGTPEAMVGSVDVVSALLDRMDNASAGKFVANAIVAEHGASQRLAEAFSCIVSDQERRRDVLSLAEEQMSDSSLRVEDGFLASWDAVEEMLESYSDRTYVSEEYSKELYSARSRAVEIEQLTEDPPMRISGWLSSIDDAELRELDLHLLLDLLSIETDPFRWHEVLDTTVAQIEDLARVGHLQAATRLTEAISVEASEQGRVFRRPFAVEALDRIIALPFVRVLALDLRSRDETHATVVKQFLHALSPAVIRSLAELWSTEDDPRLRKHLQEVVMGFGARGRDAVQKLMTAPDWEVRRAAVFLLRGFGACDVATFGPLLTDADQRVRHEAFQTLAFSGEDAAYTLLWQALTSGEPDLRKTVTTELLASKADERAAPLFCSLVKEIEPRDAPKSVYVAAIEALSRFGGPDAVQALRTALYRGSWLSPFKTRSYRTAAAAALARIGSPAAMQVLREASTQGTRDVRVISRAHLSRHKGAA
jgi:HEAT repeat protein